MDQALLTQIFELCLIPLFTALTAYFVRWLNTKNKEIKTKMNNDLLNKYLDMLTQTVEDCVTATNQTYVESLKKQGNFNKESQKIALKMSCDAVVTILSTDAKEYLESAVGDLNQLITQKVEATVNKEKIEPTSAIKEE